MRFRTHVVLEDAQADYKTILIDIKNGEQNSDAYKKINMKQRVPALQTQKGILTETPAIMTYIAQEHPRKNLIPHDNYLFATVQSFNLYLHPLFTLLMHINIEELDKTDQMLSVI